MKNKNVVIIGGGASGLAAAIEARKNNCAVTIIEHKDRVGKKILMTGNGKCNLTNSSDLIGKYFSEDISFVYDVLERFSAEDTITFFKDLGLYTKEKKNGGIYPVSEQAASVLDVLRLSCDELGVNTIVSANVKNVDFKNKTICFLCEDKNKTIRFDKLIIATGGKAASVSGSDGSGYEFAKQLGLKLIKPLPSLVQLKCDGNYFKSISGVRSEVNLSLYINNKLVCQECGELQLTDYGISGIPVFQISRHVSRALDKEDEVKVIINFLPFLSNDEIDNLIYDKRNFSYKTLEQYLNGLINKKLSVALCKICNININSKLSDLSDRDFEKVLNKLKSFEVIVKDTNGFESAQVTSGGIKLSELDSNMECKRYKDIYFVGEILDCDGICGGYNLQWAWATGVIAARHASNN